MNLEELKKKKISDLRYIAKMLGISSVSSLSKQSLIDSILNVENGISSESKENAEAVSENAEIVSEASENNGDAEKDEDSENLNKSEEKNNVAVDNAEKIEEAPVAPAENDLDKKPNKRAEKKTQKQTKEKKEKNDSMPKKSKKEKSTLQKSKGTAKSKEADDTEKVSENIQDVSAINQGGLENKEQPKNKSRKEKVDKKDSENGQKNKKDQRDKKQNRQNKEKKNSVKKEAEESNQTDAAALENHVNEVTENQENADVNVAAEEKKSKEEPKPAEIGEEAEGLLEILPEGYGFLRTDKFASGSKDVYVPPTLIRKFALKTGDKINGRSKSQRENDKYQALFYINTVNDDTIEMAFKRKPFESLIPIYPDEKIKLETAQNELSTRLIDLIAPIGKGQRGMIVSPPKAGKTVLLKKIANAISENYPEIQLIVLLIDERPEEVTDMRESVKGDVISSTFDEMPEKHIRVSEMVFERAKRLVEQGKDVVILMDSLTRLARAYNITIAPTGRSLSGGLDPGALYNPKRFFGAARNIRGGGSLTIVATALIDTGSKMDDVIFEEFKGTGNMELHLDRKLSEKRVFPAIDINKSGTRKEELLLSEKELSSVFSIRRAMSNLGTGDVTEMIVSKMTKTKNNEEFINTIKILPPEGSKG